MLKLSQAISKTEVLDYAVAVNWLSVLSCKIIPVFFILTVSHIPIELAKTPGKGEISPT
jgi:hypothetical protein